MPHTEDQLDLLVARPSEIEHFLRSLLIGIRMVGELDLTPEDEAYSSAKRVCGSFIQQRDFRRLPQVCPASLVIFLVAEGRYRYHDGNFWSKVSLPGIRDSNDSAAIGHAFLQSLSRLELETFEAAQLQEHGHRYLMPILLHGGIPYGCAIDVWQLIREEVQGGVDDGAQLVINWRNKPFLMYSLDKPAQRFLKYGGEFACDLVQRMIELSGYVAEIGQEAAMQLGPDFLAAHARLPSYLAKTILEKPADAAKTGPRLPRPHLTLDPYSGQGPLVCLPATKVRNLPQSHWTVVGPNTKTYRSSTTDDLEIPLSPARGWHIELDTGAQRRLSTFAGFERASVFFFDIRSGDIFAEQRTLPSGQVLVLAVKGIRFESSEDGAPVPEVEELPPLAGAWSSWAVHHLDVSGLASFDLVIEDQFHGTQKERVFITQAMPRPHFADQPVHAVADLNGHNVFDRLPHLKISLANTRLESWKINVKSERYNGTCALADLTQDEVGFSLTALLPENEILTAQLSVLGPLGSDFRSDLTVIPGLKIDLPDRIILPSEEVEITLTSTYVTLNHAANSCTYTLPSQSDSLNIDATDGITNVGLLVTVPRLLWTLRRHDTGTKPLSGEALIIGLDEIKTGLIESLLIRLRRTESVQLRLLGEGEVLQTSGWVTTGGDDGRWAFSLAEFADTIRLSELARLQLQLICNTKATEVEVHLASIAARYEVSNIAVESIMSDSEEFTCCEVTFQENHHFRDREIRLWPRIRPWEKPKVIAMDERDHNSCLFSLDSATPPGPYTLEIAITDPWSVPTRPKHADCNLAEVTIGTKHDLSRHLDSLDASRPLEALELFLCDRLSWNYGLQEHALEILPCVAVSLVSLLGEYGPEALTKQIFSKLTETLLIRPELLAKWIAHEAGTSMSRVELLQFAVAILPDALDCLTEPTDRQILDVLWSLSPVIGALFTPYRTGDNMAAAYWQHFTGWNPAMPQGSDDTGEQDRLPSRGGGIQHRFTTLSPERLSELAAILRPDEVKPLRWVGYLEGAFELLQSAWQDRPAVERWRSSHSRLNDQRARLEKVHETYLEALAPEPHTAGWCQFPQDLLAGAFHLVSYSGERVKATTALWEASTFAPTLAERSLLIAITLHRLGA